MLALPNVWATPTFNLKIRIASIWSPRTYKNLMVEEIENTIMKFGCVGTIGGKLLERFLPRAHAQGVKQSYNIMSVVVRTKIACLGDLGAWATSKANEYVEIGEELASVYFELFCTDHKRHKYCNLSHACRPHLLIGSCMCSLHMRITVLAWQVMVASRLDVVPKLPLCCTVDQNYWVD